MATYVSVMPATQSVEQPVAGLPAAELRRAARFSFPRLAVSFNRPPSDGREQGCRGEVTTHATIIEPTVRH